MVSTWRPACRSTSARVRTVVVLPVPPLSDRTAIVSAMWPPRYRAVRGCPALELDGGPRRFRRVHRIQEIDRVPADEDLVAVLQRAPLHPSAVDLDAVERAVVEDPHPALLAGDQRVAARDRRVVEAD